MLLNFFCSRVVSNWIQAIVSHARI